jgi:hypothetical protein
LFADESAEDGSALDLPPVALNTASKASANF